MERFIPSGGPPSDGSDSSSESESNYYFRILDESSLAREAENKVRFREAGYQCKGPSKYVIRKFELMD
jgi:hypothetical protein